MFRELINCPIDPIPSQYVNSLVRLEHEPDYSLTCLGVALFKSRIDGYGGIIGTYRSYDNEATCLVDFLNDQYPKLDTYPMFCYYRYVHEAEDGKAIIKDLEEKGFEIKENVGALIKNKANLKCVAAFHKEKNCAVVLINSQDIKFYHLIISFLSLLLPNLFKEKPMEADDFELVKALTKTDKDTFVQEIQKKVKDYVSEFRKMMLENLLKSIHAGKLTSALSSVNSARQNVANLEVQISSAWTKLKELSAIYEGLKATEQYDEPEKEFVDYLSSHKLIHNFEIDGNNITFTVATLLNNYNADSWAGFHRRGTIFDGVYRQNNLLEVFNVRENRQTLLDQIFNESPVFAVKIAGNYTLDISNAYVSTSRTYDYDNADPLFKSYLPNPHLKLYNCLGGYESRISKALRDRDYIRAIELCCASAGSVNLDETEQTFRPFLGYILTSREKILRRISDGVDMTPEEALVYLVDNKEKNNETISTDSASRGETEEHVPF